MLLAIKMRPYRPFRKCIKLKYCLAFLKCHLLFFHGNFFDLPAKFCQLLFVLKEGMIRGNAGNITDFFKSQRNYFHVGISYILPKCFIFAHGVTVFYKSRFRDSYSFLRMYTPTENFPARSLQNSFFRCYPKDFQPAFRDTFRCPLRA